MIRILSDMPPGVLGLEAVGDIEKDDYKDVIAPAVEAAIAEHDKIRRLTGHPAPRPRPRADMTLSNQLVAMRPRGQVQPTGEPLTDHIRRVAAATPEFARPCGVASRSTRMDIGLRGGLALRWVSDDELRALRLLTGR